MGLVSELRRRNVLRMAVLYAVAAWLIVQVAGVLIDLAKLPDWIGTTTLWLLAVGFPIALIFSWFYEFTPEGISLEKDVDPEVSITQVTGRRLDFLVISLLCAAVILFSYDKWWLRGPLEKSIAVLPFENTSADPEQEYFADGMTEALITELSKISALRVISRQSVMRFKGSNEPLPEIARKLNVDTVVEGSALLIGDQVRITVQLIEAATDLHLWADSYDRDFSDVLALHSDVARSIADKIQIVVTPAEEARLTSAREVNPDAHQAYLKGRYHLNKRTDDGLENAKQQFEYAIELDAEYAIAYSGLADAYLLLAGYGLIPLADARPKQKAAAFKALDLDETSPEAHASVSAVLARDWDWTGAERELKRAIEINPNYAQALQWYGSLLAIMGRPGHLAMMKRAQKVDPFSLRINVDLGLAYYYNEDYEQAIRQLQNTLELEPEFMATNGALGLVFIEMGNFKMGIEEIENGSGGSLSIWLGYAHAKAGNTEKALIIAEEWRKRWEDTRRGAVPIALIYLALGQIDDAFDWLNRAIDNRDLGVTSLQSYTYWNPLRSDPRYIELLRRMNLVD
jgi:adenylate cyclase